MAIRALKAKYASSPGFAFHTYAEDTDLNRFAEAMTALHGGIDVEKFPHLRALPIAGIKTASAFVQHAGLPPARQSATRHVSHRVESSGLRRDRR